MVEKFETSLFGYMKAIGWGEDILVEYTSNEPIHLVFWILIKYLRESNYPFVIVDVLDQLHVFRTHLDLVGIESSGINEAGVVKLGGILKTGNVIGRIDLDEDIPVWKKHYDDLLMKSISQHVFRVVIGLEKALAIYERTPRDLERFFGLAIRSYLGDKRRITVYFVNTDLINDRTIKELREGMSRVFSVELAEGEVVLKIIKSINFSDHGLELRARAQELQRYLSLDT